MVLPTMVSSLSDKENVDINLPPIDYGSNEKGDDNDNTPSGKIENVDSINVILDSSITNHSSINFASSDGKLTVGDLKKEFKTAGIDDSNNYLFKPFYNVEPNTEFTFHFNSKVDPIKAITVHTDEKCDFLSLVWQLNEAYWTNNGIDVVVKPGSPVLSSDGRENKEKGIWGYAPIYYLCVRYDLESTEVKKLEKPIIIPFTIKNKISTPTVFANIDDNGTFSIKWNKVEGAKSYKVYSGPKSPLNGYSLAETGYQWQPKLVATLNSSELEFNPGYLLTQEKVVLGGEGYEDNTVREKDEKYSIELVHRQNDNLYNLHSIFITAVDANGNESNYGTPIMLEKYKNTLPNMVPVKELNRYTTLTEFPDFVNVESVDNKTLMQYPVNFYRIGEISEYLTYCDYKYEVIGTELVGIVSYKNENKIFPESHLSDFVPQTSYMPQNTIDKIPQVTVDTFSDNDYSSSKVDLTKKVDYSEDAKVELDVAKIYVLLDMDGARRIITPEADATDPREEFDSFIADDDPEYVLKKENGTIIVEKVDKTTQKPEENKPVVEKPKEEKEPAKEIDNTNYVEEQKKSTEKQVEKADKEEVKGSKYPVFANNAAQMYLALAMINQEEVISLKAFPEYQDMNNLVDDLCYLWYQNPYIMGVDLNKTRYDYVTQSLILKYNLPKSTAQKYQEAVYQKSKQVVDKIIKPNMTDTEKVIAIYDYLEKNAKYNHEALDYAMTGATDVYQKYPNSWNTYGILCEEYGVCQSYAYAFDLLAHLSDVESVMVTGFMNNGGHAWNAVKLNGKWYMIDTTNNGATTGIPYWICNTSTDFIEGITFVLDEGFVDGVDYSPFNNNDDKADWYYVNDLMADNGIEIAEIWEAKHATNKTIFIKCLVNTQAEFDKILDDFATKVVKDGYDPGKWVMRAVAGYIILQEVEM